MSFDFFWPKPPTGAIQHRSHVTLYTHVTFSLVNIEKSRLEYVWQEAWVLFTKMFKNPAKEVYWNDMYMCRLISTMYIFFYQFFFFVGAVCLSWFTCWLCFCQNLQKWVPWITSIWWYCHGRKLHYIIEKIFVFILFSQ